MSTSLLRKFNIFYITGKADNDFKSIIDYSDNFFSKLTWVQSSKGNKYLRYNNVEYFLYRESDNSVCIDYDTFCVSYIINFGLNDIDIVDIVRYYINKYFGIKLSKIAFNNRTQY